MADQRLGSVTTAPPERGHVVVHDPMRRLGLPAACGWLVLVAGVEFLLSYRLLQLGEPIDVPALAVAGAGFGLGLLGYFLAVALKDKGKVDVSPSARRALAIGVFSLPVLSLGWNLGGSGFWVLPAACVVAVLGGFVCIVGVISRRKAPFFFATVLLLTVSIILSFLVGIVPNALSLKFAWNYEAGLNKQVAVGPGPSWFAMPGQADWSFAYESKAPVDDCARHLLGPWWEVANEAPSCPTGFLFVAGP